MAVESECDDRVFTGSSIAAKLVSILKCINVSE
jgi:hypothetical protein